MPQSSLASILNFQIFFLGVTPPKIYTCQYSRSVCPAGDLQTKPSAAWVVERQPTDSHAWSLHGPCEQSLSEDGPCLEEAKVSQGVVMCCLQALGALACCVASGGCLVHPRGSHGMRAQRTFQVLHTVLPIAGSVGFTSHSMLEQKESLPRVEGGI